MCAAQLRQTVRDRAGRFGFRRLPRVRATWLRIGAFLAVIGPGFIIVLGLADLGNIAAEFAGIASALGIFGISKYLAVPAAAVLVWAVVVRGSYSVVERVLLVLSFAYFAYPVSAWLSHPQWSLAVEHTFLPEVKESSEYLLMVIGLVGTTITPWMQFYLQASIVEKGIGKREYALNERRHDRPDRRARVDDVRVRRVIARATPVSRERGTLT